MNDDSDSDLDPGSPFSDAALFAAHLGVPTPGQPSASSGAAAPPPVMTTPEQMVQSALAAAQTAQQAVSRLLDDAARRDQPQQNRMDPTRALDRPKRMNSTTVEKDRELWVEWEFTFSNWISSIIRLGFRCRLDEDT